jgi:arylsulfatase A-like enzyme
MKRFIHFTLLAALAASGCTRAPEPPPRPTSVLLISIDTCRADHLSAYGYPRETTPFLEEFATRGFVFERAFAQAPDTTPSHASILTSLYPFAHGAAHGVPLRDEFVTLAEVLAERGFATAGFVSGWTMEREASGLGQGFATYDDTFTQQGMRHFKFANERPAGETADRALDWLEASGDDPFFMFVHFFDPHGRYDPPAPYDTMFPPVGLGDWVLPIEAIPQYARIEGETDVAVYVSRYDGEIRYVDDQIRRIVERLDALGKRDDTLIVVTADHGESLTEHGVYFAHGWRLFDPSIHVPLIVSHPPSLGSGIRIPDVVQTVDVMPTILELLEVDHPGPFDGASLVPLSLGEASHPTSYAASSTTKSLTYLSAGTENQTHDHFSLRTLDWKYLEPKDQPGRMLFDLRADPGELRDVAGQHPDRADTLQALLERIVAERGDDEMPPLEELSEEERQELEERLRSLGYIK